VAGEYGFGLRTGQAKGRDSRYDVVAFGDVQALPSASIGGVELKRDLVGTAIDHRVFTEPPGQRGQAV
jgi:hypothetical protein